MILIQIIHHFNYKFYLYKLIIRQLFSWKNSFCNRNLHLGYFLKMKKYHSSYDKRIIAYDYLIENRIFNLIL